MMGRLTASATAAVIGEIEGMGPLPPFIRAAKLMSNAAPANSIHHRHVYPTRMFAQASSGWLP